MEEVPLTIAAGSKEENKGIKKPKAEASGFFMPHTDLIITEKLR